MKRTKKARKTRKKKKKRKTRTPPKRHRRKRKRAKKRSARRWRTKKKTPKMRRTRRKTAGRPNARRRMKAKKKTPERARAQAIFASPAAGIRPEIAAQLAFQTSLPSDEAIALLASIAAGAPRRSADLAERMATIPSPNVGVEGAEPNGARTLAAHILAAGRKARGERLPTEQEQR